MKLSPRQQEVIDLMNDGWEMGVSVTMDSRCWLQKNGVGRGGKTLRVHGGTFNSLWDKGLIEPCEYSFPTRKYRLAKSAIEHEQGEE